jgi:hypothetical protein
VGPVCARHGGAFVAAGLFLIQIGAGQPRWAFAAAAAGGLVIGLVRGMMIGVRHDHYRPVVMISRDAKLVFLAVGIGVGVCAALEIIAAYTSPALEKVRLWAALSRRLRCGDAGPRAGADDQAAPAVLN